MDWYVLAINPDPWAIGPLSIGRKNGKMFPMVGRNQQLFSYQEAVREELGTDHEPIQGSVRLVFYFWRQTEEYKTAQARAARKHEADVTNLQKATEDAIQGILLGNDRDVTDVHSYMVEQGPNVAGKVAIGIEKVNIASLPEFPPDLQDLLDQEVEYELFPEHPLPEGFF